MPFKNVEDRRRYRRVYYKKYYTNPIKRKKRVRESVEAKKIRYKTDSLFRIKERQRNKANYIKRIYGVSLKRHEEIVSRPCDICGTVEYFRVIDHCHETGKHRGVLCTMCNTNIEWFIRHRGPIEIYYGTL